MLRKGTHDQPEGEVESLASQNQKLKAGLPLLNRSHPSCKSGWFATLDKAPIPINIKK